MIGDAPVGALDHDLRSACFAALDISRQDCVEFAANYTWEASARAFIDSILAVGAVLPGRNGQSRRDSSPESPKPRAEMPCPRLIRRDNIQA